MQIPLINLCECGCGLETPIGKRFRKSHTSQGGGNPYYVERDMGHDTPCWYWLRAVCKDGYPKANRGRMHRVYYEDAVRPLRKGEVIDHLCRVHRCVNPAHMEAVSERENYRRGIHVKLQESDVPLILALLESGFTCSRIAPLFGVSDASIGQVRDGDSFKEFTS